MPGASLGQPHVNQRATCRVRRDRGAAMSYIRPATDIGDAADHESLRALLGCLIRCLLSLLLGCLVRCLLSLLLNCLVSGLLSLLLGLILGGLVCCLLSLLLSCLVRCLLGALHIRSVAPLRIPQSSKLLSSAGLRCKGKFSLWWEAERRESNRELCQVPCKCWDFSGQWQLWGAIVHRSGH